MTIEDLKDKVIAFLVSTRFAATIALYQIFFLAQWILIIAGLCYGWLGFFVTFWLIDGWFIAVLSKEAMRKALEDMKPKFGWYATKNQGTNDLVKEYAKLLEDAEKERMKTIPV